MKRNRDFSAGNGCFGSGSLYSVKRCCRQEPEICRRFKFKHISAGRFGGVDVKQQRICFIFHRIQRFFTVDRGRIELDNMFVDGNFRNGRIILADLPLAGKTEMH